MKRLLLLALVALASACQPTYFGASNLALSRAHVSYNGPVYGDAGYTPAQGSAVVARREGEQGGPIVLVDYEHNGVSSDGIWDAADHNAYFAMAFRDERCTVIAMGWRYDQWQDELVVARADLDAIATARRSLGYPTVVVDLRPILGPDDVSVDGVHLTTPDAARRYGAALTNAQASCP